MLQLFRDSLSTTYENILALDTVEVLQVHEDYLSALNETVEIAGDQTTMELDAGTQLFLFEFIRSTKTVGINNPSVTIEWLGIKIP